MDWRFSLLVMSSHFIRNLKMPFAKCSTEQVCEWLEEIGLGQYIIIARHWVTSGQTLLSATPQDLERVDFCEIMFLMHLSGS